MGDDIVTINIHRGSGCLQTFDSSSRFIVIYMDETIITPLGAWFMRKIRTRIFILGLIILSLLVGWWLLAKVNSDFATEALLEYGCYYRNEDISIKITDENDIRSLKEILRGHPFEDSPSCGFGGISITMTDGNKSIVFHPAGDGCRVLRIGNSYKYITIPDNAKTRLHEVLKKYGVSFPYCI
jgi:hypothetical protein